MRSVQAILPITKGNEMMKQEIITALEASDVWTKDRFGHFKLTFGPSQYRLKVQPLAIRYEKKDGSDWYAKTSGYYKDTTVQDGFLRIGSWRVPITSATMPEVPEQYR